MKTTRFIALFAAFAVAMVSCDDKEKGETPNPGDGKLTAPVLSSEQSAVVLEESKATQNALELSWTAASTEQGVNVSYEIYVNTAGKDIFTDPQKVAAGSATSKNITHAELNSIAVALGADYGVSASYKVLVYAVHTNGSYESVSSNQVELTITPYMPTPNYFIIAGAAMNWKWSLDDTAARINETSAGSGIYEGAGFEMRFGTAQGFKLYFPTDGDDAGFLAQDPGKTTFGAIKYFKTGDTQFLPLSHSYVNGIYTVKIDLNTMQLTLTKTGDVSVYPTSLYIRGNAINWDWDNAVQTLASTEEGVYRGTEIPLSVDAEWQGFVFFEVYTSGQDWPQYVQNSNGILGDLQVRNDGDPESNIVLFGTSYTSGLYTINVNLKTLKMTLERTGDLPAVIPDWISVAGAALPWGWDRNDDRATINATSTGIYEFTTVFDLGDDGWNSFKFWTDSEWGNEHLQDPAGPFGAIIHMSQPGGDAFYPGLPNTGGAGLPADFPHGNLSAGVNYKVTINLNTMMMTIVPAE